MKHCPNCKIDKPFSDFASCKSGGFYTYCKPCASVKNRSYRKHKRQHDVNYHRNKNAKQIAERQNNKNIRVCHMFTTSKRNAIDRGIEFDISLDDLKNIYNRQEWRCAKTGIPFDLIMNQSKRPFGPSIDRINPNLGYSADNIQIVCNMYNFAKNQFSDGDVIMFAFALIENLKRR